MPKQKVCLNFKHLVSQPPTKKKSKQGAQLNMQAYHIGEFYNSVQPSLKKAMDKFRGEKKKQKTKPYKNNKLTNFDWEP